MNAFYHASSEQDKIHTEALIKTYIKIEHAHDGMFHYIP